MGLSNLFFAKRAQVATEYLILVGVSLIIIAALTGYSFIQYNDSVSANQAANAVKELSNAAKKVYSFGDGSAVLITVSLPSNVTNFSAGGRALEMNSSSFGFPSSDLVEFDFNVSGSLPTAQGVYTIAVSNNNGVVVFSEA